HVDRHKIGVLRTLAQTGTRTVATLAKAKLTSRLPIGDDGAEDIDDDGVTEHEAIQHELRGIRDIMLRLEQRVDRLERVLECKAVKEESKLEKDDAKAVAVALQVPFPSPRHPALHLALHLAHDRSLPIGACCYFCLIFSFFGVFYFFVVYFC